jgi:hypothetical protein
METKEIYKKLHQFVDEVSLGYKGTIDLNLLREAADRLKAMDAQIYQHREEIADLEKQLAEQQTQWISVAERLPGAYGRYISYNGEDIIIRYFDPVRQGSWDIGEVTHWMPLPEPPKPKEPTFKDKFLEAFPKAEVYDDYGVIVKCCAVFPWLLDEKGFCQMDMACEECWNQPYFEEEVENEAHS